MIRGDELLMPQKFYGSLKIFMSSFYDTQKSLQDFILQGET
jgi:hypothetical protein